MNQEAATIRINPAMALQKPLEDYIQYLEKMTTRSVRLLDKLAAPGMRYADSLYDVRGSDEIAGIFRRRLETVHSPKIRIRDHAWGQDGQTVYLRWTFSCRRDGVEDIRQGVSEIMFSKDGLVLAHMDYPDMYERLPPPSRSLLGRIFPRLNKP